MPLSHNATPEELILYTEKLAGGNYGEPVDICYSDKNIFENKKDPNSSTLKEKKVCGYVAYLLGVGLSNFPGCSEKDRYSQHEITPQTIQEFKRRIAYLLPEFEIVLQEKSSAKAA